MDTSSIIYYSMGQLGFNKTEVDNMDIVLLQEILLVAGFVQEKELREMRRR